MVLEVREQERESDLYGINSFDITTVIVTYLQNDPSAKNSSNCIASI